MPRRSTNAASWALSWLCPTYVGPPRSPTTIFDEPANRKCSPGIFCFIVESSLVLFLYVRGADDLLQMCASSLANVQVSSFSLAATVYGWWAKKPQALRKLSITGRVVPIAFALLSVILLQLELVHRSFTLYFIIANAQRKSLTASKHGTALLIFEPVIISLAVSCVFLLMILGKYVQTRRQLKTWQSIQYGKLGSTTNSGSRNALNRRSRGCSTAGKASAVFDKWLVVRLSIAFMALWWVVPRASLGRFCCLSSANPPAQRLRMDKHSAPHRVQRPHCRIRQRNRA